MYPPPAGREQTWVTLSPGGWQETGKNRLVGFLSSFSRSGVGRSGDRWPGRRLLPGRWEGYLKAGRTPKTRQGAFTKFQDSVWHLSANVMDLRATAAAQYVAILSGVGGLGGASASRPVLDQEPQEGLGAVRRVCGPFVRNYTRRSAATLHRVRSPRAIEAAN